MCDSECASTNKPPTRKPTSSASLFFKARRSARALGQSVVEPKIVEFARSFFPVILIVLLVRSFVFEPFRIPSASMMPGLVDGDFIFVNKFSYGLRLPVLNTKVVSIDEPTRGDVVVFRLPSSPSTNYIKRLVGLPGDHVVVRVSIISMCCGSSPECDDNGRISGWEGTFWENTEMTETRSP